jgi:hypothetical protein
LSRLALLFLVVRRFYLLSVRFGFHHAYVKARHRLERLADIRAAIDFFDFGRFFRPTVAFGAWTNPDTNRRRNAT